MNVLVSEPGKGTLGSVSSGRGARPPAARLLLWLAPLAFLGIFFFLPFARILSYSFGAGALNAASFQLALHTLLFTLYQALLSTLLTLAVGIPAAYLFARFQFPAKSLLRALTAVPFMLPTVVVAAGFNALLGPRGLANLALMQAFGLSTPPVAFVGTLGAILLAHVFYNTTIVIRLLGNALSRLDPRLEQAARSLGADSPRLWWHVNLPLLRPSLLAASLLVFLFDFTSFGVILLLGGPAFATLEVQIYVESLYFLNLPLAALLASIQLACTLAFSILYTRVLSHSVVQTAPRSAAVNLRRARSLPEKLLVGGMIFVVVSLFVLPMLALPIRSVSRLDAERGQRTGFQAGFTTEYYSELFVNRRNSISYVPPVRAASDSLAYAAATVFLSLAMGFPAACGLRETRSAGEDPRSDPDPAAWGISSYPGARLHCYLRSLADLSLARAIGSYPGRLAVCDPHSSTCACLNSDRACARRPRRLAHRRSGYGRPWIGRSFGVPLSRRQPLHSPSH